MLSLGTVVGGIVRVGVQEHQVSCFGDVYNGVNMTTSEPVLLLHVHQNAHSTTVDLASVPSVFEHKLIDAAERDGQILAFSADAKPFCKGSFPRFVRDARIGENALKKLLLSIALMIEGQENSKTKSGPFFNPYLAPNAVFLDAGGEPAVLGASIDFDYRGGEGALPALLKRYVLPAYVTSRLCGGGRTPKDEGLRRKASRFGLGIMIWEAATGVEQTYDAEVPPDLSSLSPAWKASGPLIRKCLGLEGWGSVGLASACRQAFAVDEAVPSPSAPITEESSAAFVESDAGAIEAPDWQGEHAPEPRSAVRTFTLIVFSLLIGAILAASTAAVILHRSGIDLRDLQETERLRKKVQKLQREIAASGEKVKRLEEEKQGLADLKAWSLCDEWCVANDERREAILAEAARNPPVLLRLKYLQLVEASANAKLNVARDLLAELTKAPKDLESARISSDELRAIEALLKD